MFCPSRRGTPRCAKRQADCLTETDISATAFAYTTVNNMGVDVPMQNIQDITLQQLYAYTLTEMVATAHGSASTVVFGFGKSTQDAFAIKAHLVFDLPTVLSQISLENPCLHKFERERATAIVAAQNKSIAQLEHEAIMYSQLAKTTAGLPNMVRWITTLHISRTSVQLCTTQDADANWKKFIMQLTFQPNTEFWTGIGLVVTERRPEAISLQQFCKQHKAILDDPQHNVLLCSITFQILFTLAGLQQLGYQHNDLHANNILVDMAPDANIISYFMHDTTFHVPVDGGMVLFFDWDLGTTAAGPLNQHLKYAHTCDQMGVCEEQNPYFDMFRILKQLSLVVKNTRWQTFYEEIIGGTYSEVKTKLLHSKPMMTDFMDNLCAFAQGKMDVLFQPLDPGEPKFMRTPAEALQNSYFKDFLMSDYY